MDDDSVIRGYAAEVVACSRKNITSVFRFEAGDRHAVYRVAYRDAQGGANGVVVRVAIHDDPAERAHAEVEAAVLEQVHGTGAPLLYDFRSESSWFDAPAMCMQLIDGEHRDLVSAPLDDVERLGAVVAAVHNLDVDSLVGRLPTAGNIAAYVDERLELNTAYLPRLRDPLPSSLRSRVDGAFTAVNASVEWARRAESFRTDERLVLLHGDVGSGNTLWSPDPVLIDWEYARFGDPADEVAYIFGQHGLTEAQRTAFWNGYTSASLHPRIEHVVERARWWEPVLLLGSALWWLERWSRRADADDADKADPGAAKPQSYYLEQATRRLDRFDDATNASPSSTLRAPGAPPRGAGPLRGGRRRATRRGGH